MSVAAKKTKMDITRTFDILENLKSFSPKEDILARKSGGSWHKVSIEQYIEKAHLVAYGLLALGYGSDTKVISICTNRPEWNFVDMGANLAHMVHVPVYPTLSHDDFVHIFTNSDAQVIFVGTQALYNKISPITAEIERDIKVILMDDSEDLFCISKLYALGEENREKFAPVVEKNKETISKDECCSIIYTSGTTGVPKGVMLSHNNLMFNAKGHAARQILTSKNKMVSFLPLCHVYERSMNYEYQMLGIGTYYAESLATIAADMKSCHTDGFCAVPRVLEMMYGKLESAGKQLKGIKRIIYSLAWTFANNYGVTGSRAWTETRRAFYDKLVYRKWRENLGGNEMLIVSGGSSIQAKIVRTFNAAKLYIFEGYGMTEASPVIAVNSPADKINVIGTVGFPLLGTELSFAEDGEILTRGPHVMLGYYKNPEATAEIIDKDGWLHTGDVGCLVDGKYLKITDRKKEIFKLSAGKYIAPQVIETLLKESPYIDQAFVVGENQKFASAIIVPNVSKLKSYAKSRYISIKKDTPILENTFINRLLHSEVNKVNGKLAAHEQVKRPHFVLDDWTTENGCLSQTLKLKRKNLQAKYADVISEIYKADEK